MASWRRELSWLGGALLVLAAAHAWTWRPTEPYFNNDETRHVMTGVFVRDALADGGWTHPRSYATRYYLQYPALGLLAWPPLFHAVEGLAMLVLGTSFGVAKLVLAAFALMAGIFVYRLARLTGRTPPISALATLLTGLTPVVFLFSRHVMLEVPTLAWAMASIFYFERYLSDGRRRDALTAGLAAAAAALTRFDAVFLLPYFVARLFVLHRCGELRRPAVLGGIALALMLTAPYYALTWKEYGGAIRHQASDGTGADSAAFRAARNLPFYPLGIPRQAGIPIAIAAAVGLGACLRRRRVIGVYLTLMPASYFTFTPLAELEDRHVIYWLPALGLFAAEAFAWIGDVRLRCVGGAALALLVLAPRLDNPTAQVHGYADAAQTVLDHGGESNVVFFDGCLSGGFIYQVRRHNPSRSVTVLRGDKLVYGVLSDPAGGYSDFARSSAEVLALLHRYDPDWVVIEYPQVKFPDLPGPQRLRRALRDHPERYEHMPQLDVPLRTDHELFQGVVLEFYRPVKRNPHREPLREMPMLNLQEPVRRT